VNGARRTVDDGNDDGACVFVWCGVRETLRRACEPTTRSAARSGLDNDD
jgi:hypothetical protein